MASQRLHQSESSEEIQMYAVVREVQYDLDRLSHAAEKLEEFQRLHAAQPGYLGSLTVDVGQGRRLAINLWRSEAQAIAGRETLGPAVRRLLEPLMAAPSQLIGAGPVIENDLIEA